VPGHVVRLDDEASQDGAAQLRRLGKALRLDEARVDGMHVNASLTQLGCRRPGERELCVLRRRIRPGWREGDRAGDRDDVHDVGASGRLEPGEKGPEHPDSAEVVHTQHLF